jgi:rhodanese-related sulfurtransferase
MQEISPEKLSEQLQNGDEAPFVLDIRHEADFEEWHIPGSINVDVYDELTEDPEQAKEPLSGLSHEDQIVTICAAGVVSETATDGLRELDYDAVTLTDGMNGWSRVHRHAKVATDLEGALIQVARPGKGCLSHVPVSDGEAAVFDPSHYSRFSA